MSKIPTFMLKNWLAQNRAWGLTVFRYDSVTKFTIEEVRVMLATRRDNEPFDKF